MEYVQNGMEKEEEKAINHVRREMEASLFLTLQKIEQRLSTSHNAELVELRTELQQSLAEIEGGKKRRQ